MADEWNKEDGSQSESIQHNEQQPNAEQNRQPEFAQQSEFAKDGREPSASSPLTEEFEGSETDTLTPQDQTRTDIEQDFGRSDGQSSGFIGQESAGSDEYLQTEGQGDLASEDALTQENDDGMGEAGSEESSSF